MRVRFLRSELRDRCLGLILGLVAAVGGARSSGLFVGGPTSECPRAGVNGPALLSFGLRQRRCWVAVAGVGLLLAMRYLGGDGDRRGRTPSVESRDAIGAGLVALGEAGLPGADPDKPIWILPFGSVQGLMRGGWLCRPSNGFYWTALAAADQRMTAAGVLQSRTPGSVLLGPARVWAWIWALT